MLNTSLTRLKPSEDDWDRQKGAIRRLFLQERCSIGKLVEYLEDHNIHVSKSQVEYKLKQWKFRRLMDKKAWNFVRHRISKRKRDGKESEVILSGIRLRPETIHKETLRNRPLPRFGKTHQSPSPEPPSELSLTVCSPPPLTMKFDWPRNLPWIHFQTQAHETLSIPSLLKYDQAEAVDRFVHGLVHIKNSSLLAMYSGVSFRRNLPMIAAQLGLVIPESCEGDNLARAEVLFSGSGSERLRVMLEIFIAKLSNNDVSWDEIESNWELLRPSFEYPAASILSRQLMESHTIKAFSYNLFKLAFNASIEAIRGGTTKKPNPDIAHQVMSWILQGGYHPDTPHLGKRGTPLQVAVRYGDRLLETIHLLLEHGADMGTSTILGGSPAVQIVLDDGAMMHCTGSNPNVSMLRDLLIEKAIKSPQQSTQQLHILLQYAIRHGKKSLLEGLCTDGADLRFCQREDFGLTSEVTAITCAARYCGNSCEEPWDNWLQFVLRLMAPNDPECLRNWSPQLFVDPLIAAAGAGNNMAIQYFFELGAILDSENEDGIYPLIAAIANGKVHTSMLLIKLGADINKAGPGGISAMHVAAMTGQRDMVQILVESKAEMTLELETDVTSVAAIFRRLWPQFGRPYFSRCGLQTALDIAVNQIGLALPDFRDEYREIVKYLLQNGASWSSCAFQADLLVEDEELLDSILESSTRTPFSNQCRYEDLIARTLKLSVRKGHCDIIAKLLRNGAKLRGGEACLALGGGHPATAELILRMGGKLVDEKGSAKSFLEVAIESEDEDTIRWALAANPGYYDSGALRTAVRLALRTNDLYPCRVLLERRPRQPTADILEGTAVAIAAGGNNFELLQDLASIIPQSHHGLLSDLDQDYNLYGSSRRLATKYWIRGSPLTSAIRAGKEETISFMVKRGYRPDPMSLFCAIADGNLEQTKAILSGSLGDLIMEDCVVCDERGELKGTVQLPSPIGTAAIWNRTEIARWLIDHGIDHGIARDGRIHHPDTYSFHIATPLQAAIMHGNLELVNILLKAGALPNEKPLRIRGGATALQHAALKGYIGIAKVLLDHDFPANINAHRAPRVGGTALEYAAAYGRIDMVQFLLCNGAKTEGTGHRQFITAVRLAEGNGFREVVKILKGHRKWTETDEQRAEEIKTFFPRGISASECSDSECSDDHDIGNEMESDSEVESKVGESSEEKSDGEKSDEEESDGGRHDNESLCLAEGTPDGQDWMDWMDWMDWIPNSASHTQGTEMALEEFDTGYRGWES
ncbi:ankyrin repeat-containing domain protein [Xylariales sp. AK1849]|nr:ankyrin repeat-containing domain protein [Xylariales sp. AK1849]